MPLSRRRVNQLVLTFAAFANAGLLPRAALAADAASLLQKADAIRNPQSSFSAQVELKNYKKGALTDQGQVTVFSRRGLEQFQSLVYINAPSADRGKILLRNGNNLWIFDPASQASVRISAQQRLLGNASNGDVVASNLLGDYTPTLAGEEQVADGDREIRECYKLALASRASSTAYHSIEFWVDKATSRPVKGKYYSSSGNLLKVAWFRKFSDQMGVARPTEVVIADGFDPARVSTMLMTDFTPRDLPEAWFRKDYLPNFKP